jgi:integrase
MMEGRIKQANGRLKAANVGVSIENKGDRFYLRATLPPKPGSEHSKPYQQRLALGIHVNPAGLKLVEAEARKVGALLDCGEFDWSPYLKALPQSGFQSIGVWTEKFETDYFQRRARNSKSEKTWETEYQQVFSKLPDEPLTAEVLRNAITGTTPDTRQRKRYVMVCSALADFAGLEVDFKPLEGCYSPDAVEPRDLPTDQQIVEERERVLMPEWKWAFGIFATYGIRTSELFMLDLHSYKGDILTVLDGKTGRRRVWPLYPEWVKQFNLVEICLLKVSGKDLGNRVSQHFRRRGVSQAYNLRHRWAVRSLEFNMPIGLAAQQMGHSTDVHEKIYHHWITEEVHQRA